MTATSEVHDFRLFGDLYLPPPEKYLTEIEIMSLQGLMLYIHRLEAALPLEHAGFETQSDDDIRRAFAIFRRKEVIPCLTEYPSLVPFLFETFAK
jgi:hypothetical protein